MVIGNLTRAEESAIHSEQNPKGGTGDSDHQLGREDAHMVQVPLPGLPLGSEAGKRGEEKKWPFWGSFNSTKLQNFSTPLP